MAKYLVQSMSSGELPQITYYRKQTNDHPSHAETGAFTEAAKAAYAATNQIPINQVQTGKFFSNQGHPRNPDAVSI